MIVRCLCKLNKSYPNCNGFRRKQGQSFTQNILFRRSLQTNGRQYASTASGGGGMNIFDRSTKTHQKNVAANYPDHEIYDYLKNEV